MATDLVDAPASTAASTQTSGSNPVVVAGSPGSVAQTQSAPSAQPAAATTSTTTSAPAAPTAVVRLLAEALPEDSSQKAESAKAEGAKSDPAKADAAKTQAPAAWTLAAPKDAPLSADDVKATEAFAKENGLTQAQAEKLLGREISTRAAFENARKAEVENAYALWLKEAKAHPEIGGEKFDGAVANAARALLAFAKADERKDIYNSPFQNNPIFLAIMNRVAAAMLPTEDTAHTSAGAPQAPVDRIKVLYGDLGKNRR